MPSFPFKVRFADVAAIKATAAALLCKIEGRDVWIPQSQIDDDSEVWRASDVGTLIISEWIAKEKGLI